MLGRLFLAALLAAAPASAETLATVRGIVVADGEARAAGPTARTGAGYLTIVNEGPEDDRLLAAESPAGERLELHATALEDGVARMAELTDGVPVPAGGTVALAPGGLHVMFLGLTDAWDAGSGVPLTLVFERAGRVSVRLPVAAGPAHGGDAGH